MRRILSMVTVLGAAAVLGACGGTDVVVQALGQDADEAGGAGQPVPLSGIEVVLLPFDRDVVFRDLTAAAATPEPQLPDSLLALQSEIAAANVEYQEATAAWSTVRDSLRELGEQMEAMDQRSAQYRLLFEDFDALDQRVGGLERTMNQSFQRFSQLQNRFASQAEEIRLQRAQWADDAFASVDSVFALRIEETGREIMVDTTGANGTVSFEGVGAGDWWVHARYELPYEELYWNEPIQAEGDRVEVRLTRENADTRPRL